jgi:hypothetical protein
MSSTSFARRQKQRRRYPHHHHHQHHHYQGGNIRWRGDDNNSNIKSLNDVTALEKIKFTEKKLLRRESASSTTGGEHLPASAGTLPQAHTKYAMDTSIWSERVEEMKEECITTETQQQLSPPNGQPMCVLC